MGRGGARKQSSAHPIGRDKRCGLCSDDMVTPTTGLPPQTSEAFAVGSEGARERPQFSPQAETKESGLCDGAMQKQGVSKILTINLNDMAKELKIK